MSKIEKQINEVNGKGSKVLSVFVTGGFPDKNNFTELVLNIFNAGADIIEIGIPFSDPIADGNVIQKSSQVALSNNINVNAIFNFVREIRLSTSKPIILMGYANPILSFGIQKFAEQALDSGVSGIIVPDIPMEEKSDFFGKSFDGLDIISLAAPTTSVERLRLIDANSSGFVYCVSTNGITGTDSKKEINSDYLKAVKNTIKKNKILVGFGISSPDDAAKVKPFCDGVIVGSAIINSLFSDVKPYRKTLNFIGKLKKALSKPPTF